LATTFTLNFVWESLHAPYLYATHTFNLSFWPLMTYAAGVDALLLLGIFFGGALMWRNFYWFRRDEALPRLYIVIAGIVVAAIIEYKAVYVFHQWTYSNLMPTVFGLGLSPLAQLALTGWLAMAIMRRIKL